MAKATCEVDGCERIREYKRYCGPHYRRWKQHGDPGIKPFRKRELTVCLFDGCGRPRRTAGLCAAHYLQQFHGQDLRPLRPHIDTTARDELGRKQCSTCFEWKPLDGFRPNKRIKGGYHSFCRACDHKKRIKKSYGITESEYQELFATRVAVCAICGGVNRDGRSLFVDHDHDSGAVRGLLCNLCNRGLGNFRDSIDLLETAIQYLKGGGMT